MIPESLTEALLLEHPHWRRHEATLRFCCQAAIETEDAETFQHHLAEARDQYHLISTEPKPGYDVRLILSMLSATITMIRNESGGTTFNQKESRQ